MEVEYPCATEKTTGMVEEMKGNDGDKVEELVDECRMQSLFSTNVFPRVEIDIDLDEIQHTDTTPVPESPLMEM